MSRPTVRRLVQLVAVLVCCLLVPAFAQSAQGGRSRLAKVQIPIRGHRPQAGHASGPQTPVKTGNVRAKDAECVYTCDTKHGLCTCDYIADTPWEGGLCCALACSDCHTDDMDD